jgi:hypothetical protein
MPDPGTDLNALAVQVKTLTDQVATLQLAQKKLAGDLNIRFEQLNDRIDKQADEVVSRRLPPVFARLSALEQLPDRDVLDFAPTLDGDWVEGRTSPDFVIAGPLVTVSGKMSVDLPKFSIITGLICSCIFEASSDILPQVVVRLRRTLGDSQVLTIIELISNESSTVVEGSLVTFAGTPNLDTHLVQSDTHDYSIQAELTFSVTSAAVVPKGFVVLHGFNVICIRAGV